MLSKLFFATPLIVALRSAIASPLPSTYVNSTLPSVPVTSYSLFAIEISLPLAIFSTAFLDTATPYFAFAVSFVPSTTVTSAIFSSLVSVNVAFTTDSTCLSAVIVYVFLPVLASTVGSPTVIRSPAVISVPKAVIFFLPASVILDKSSFANPVAEIVTLPASLVILMLSPFARSITPFFTVTSAPLADNFHRSAFFANALSLKVSDTSVPLALVVM